MVSSTLTHKVQGCWITDCERVAWADLMNIDVTSGNCVNSSVPQNVTFGEQGGVLDNAALRSSASLGWASVVVVSVSVMIGLLGV